MLKQGLTDLEGAGNPNARQHFAGGPGVQSTSTSPRRSLRDFLQRSQRALPAVRQWIADLHTVHARSAIPSSAVAFPVLARWFAPDLLQRAQTVANSPMPFPPVSAFGVPEFEAMAAMPMAGITWGDMYFVDPAQASAGVHGHELVHVVQWSTLGTEAFLLTYAVGLALHGYEQSPLETIASEFGAKVASGPPVAGATEVIARHAIRARDEAAAVFRTQGLRFGV
jgi:hypothetical protein